MAPHVRSHLTYLYIKLWDNSYLSKAVLTSVGKAIAITYIRSQNILLPYETWLSCNSSNSESSID